MGGEAKYCFCGSGAPERPEVIARRDYFSQASVLSSLWDCIQGGNLISKASLYKAIFAGFLHVSCKGSKSIKIESSRRVNSRVTILEYYENRILLQEVWLKLLISLAVANKTLRRLLRT